MPVILPLSFIPAFFYANNVNAHPSRNVSQKRVYLNKLKSKIIKHNSSRLNVITRDSMSSNFELIGDENFLGEDFDDDLGSPWEGAILYQRNSSISHVEYCTTLERLGLGHLSTEVSKSRASLMGLRVTKSVKDFPNGTPVLVSVDVTRKKQNLKLDGIIRTVLTLGCNRCGGLAADCVFSNFSVVLTEEQIKEPEIINMGVIYGQSQHEEEDDESCVDLDDWLYFPPEEKSIDISKNIRDMVHLEIKISALCDPMCKGLCLKCGQNLNTSSCVCSEQSVKPKSYGPLGDLKQKLQQ